MNLLDGHLLYFGVATLDFSAVSSSSFIESRPERVCKSAVVTLEVEVGVLLFSTRLMD